MIFDLVVLAVIVISAGIAFLRGFIREALTLLGIVGGVAAAAAVGPRLSPATRHLLHIQAGVEPHKYFGILPATIVADLLAFGVVFLVVVIGLSIVSHILSGWAKAIGLGPLNRAAGVLFGIVRALLILSLIYLPFYLWTTPAERDQSSLVEGSHTRVYIEATAGWLADLLPKSFTARMRQNNPQDTASGINETREKLQELNVLSHLSRPADKAHDNPGQIPGDTTPANAMPPSYPTAVTSSPAPQMPDQPPQPAANTGYAPAQRQDLNSLINQGLGT